MEQKNNRGNYPLYFLKEAVRNISVSPFSNLVSILTIATALSLVGFFGVIGFNLNRIIEGIDRDFKLNIYLKEGVSEEDVNRLLEEIRTRKWVKTADYFNRQEDLERNLKVIPKDLLGIIDKEMIPVAGGFEVKLNELDFSEKERAEIMKWVGGIGEMEQVVEPPAGVERVSLFYSLTRTFRYLGIVLSVVILFSAVFFVFITINLTIQRRRSEIEIMRITGATKSFIEIPLFIEGIFQGISGAALSLAGVISLSQHINRHIGDVLFLNIRIELFPFTLFLWMSAGGILIGVAGTYISTRRHLKV